MNTLRLTKRQYDVLKLYVSGHSVKEVASILDIEDSTVRNTLLDVRHRCNLQTMQQLVIVAILNNFFTVENKWPMQLEVVGRKKIKPFIEVNSEMIQIINTMIDNGASYKELMERSKLAKSTMYKYFGEKLKERKEKARHERESRKAGGWPHTQWRIRRSAG